VPLNHGGRLDQNDGAQTAWPYPVKPKPDYTVDWGEAGPSGTLATEDRQLVSERENLKLQFRAAPKPTGEPRHDGRNESEHADDTTAAQDKSLHFSTLSEFLVWTPVLVRQLPPTHPHASFARQGLPEPAPDHATPDRKGDRRPSGRRLASSLRTSRRLIRPGFLLTNRRATAGRPSSEKLRIGGFSISIRVGRSWFGSQSVSFERINSVSNSRSRSNSGSEEFLVGTPFWENSPWICVEAIWLCPHMRGHEHQRRGTRT
jgi:hypothetical protein